ncbi:MAG: tetratricopeptide repeat protein, partial [Lentisphaeria bacterium]|nr:tetratricopeptide repeat protein [Lentisphaeria bacterium]
LNSDYKSEAHDSIALILSSLKKYDDALTEYDKLLAMRKISPYWAVRGRCNRANLLVKMEKKEEAVKCYKQALAVKGYSGWVKKYCIAQLKKCEPK